MYITQSYKYKFDGIIYVSANVPENYKKVESQNKHIIEE